MSCIHNEQWAKRATHTLLAKPSTAMERSGVVLTATASAPNGTGPKACVHTVVTVIITMTLAPAKD